MIRLDILRFTAQQYRQRRKVSFILFLISNLWLFSVLLYFQKPVFYLFCLLGTSVALGARLRKLQKERILVENINSQSIFGRPHRVNHHLDFEAGFADENMAERLPTDRELAAFPRFLLTDNPGELSDASTRTPATDSTSLSDVQAPRERPDLHIPDEWEGEQDPAHRFIGGLPNQRRFIRVHLYNRSPGSSTGWWSSTRGDWTGFWPEQTATLQASKKSTLSTSRSRASTKRAARRILTTAPSAIARMKRRNR